VVRVRTPEAPRLRALLVAADVSVTSTEPDLLEVAGLSSEQIGRVAFDQRVPLAELTPVQASLEEAFMELTQDAVEYHVEMTGSLERAA
jgi:ABC-2 type transport system ATP-binding protein